MEYNFDECVRSGVEQAMKECELIMGMTLKECVEKQIPKVLNREGWDEQDWCYCPGCNQILGDNEYMWDVFHDPYRNDVYCTYCGQRLKDK